MGDALGVTNSDLPAAELPQGRVERADAVGAGEVGAKPMVGPGSPAGQQRGGATGDGVAGVDPANRARGSCRQFGGEQRKVSAGQHHGGAPTAEVFSAVGLQAQ